MSSISRMYSRVAEWLLPGRDALAEVVERQPQSLRLQRARRRNRIVDLSRRR
jgi:hypothetical protein